MTTNAWDYSALEWTFGDRIRKIRRMTGLSQTAFAERLDAKQATIGAWELAYHEPRGGVSIAKRIELAFGVPATWTLGLDTTVPRPDGPDGAPRDGELPRLDSNQQPFGLATGADAEIIAFPEPVAA